jgi:flavin-dependent dehydrogenase
MGRARCASIGGAGGGIEYGLKAGDILVQVATDFDLEHREALLDASEALLAGLFRGNHAHHELNRHRRRPAAEERA